jgi:hypothetical protein
MKRQKEEGGKCKRKRKKGEREIGRRVKEKGRERKRKKGERK